MNNSKKERNNIAAALNVLDIWFETHDRIKTGFGEVYTVNGYQISNIRCMPNWVCLDIYVLDRSVQEKDFVREGDKVWFRYNIDTKEIALQE